MKLTFVELSRFSAFREAYFGNDDGFRSLQELLLADPTRGDVIPNGGGTRKLRVTDPRRGKGKRGGLRVIYLHIPEIDTIVFFAVYDKNEASDLTVEQRRNVAAASASVRAELIAAALGS